MIKALSQKLAGSAWFSQAGPRLMRAFDPVARRLAGSRMTERGRIPALLLTTTGAKSGLPRAVPLACLPEPGGALLVVGSNFGGPRHPAWTANLLARPQATVRFGGREFPVTASLLTGAERAEAWPRLVAHQAVYARYTERSGRELRVFRLIPTD
ncbi:nitroreductase family deazaflavin-dependent oxidoreductase [Nonomuraea sp. ATR24]|uniref:nitroreductase family deazaflavin-dependent oxidoreductase n=1 Tax=Nonomuraea TaxID=83681 RepID=UPI001C606907|nr:nitroreductase family deazaflavin-dependent oxidoreductase [Nonomuraea ceibae]